MIAGCSGGTDSPGDGSNGSNGGSMKGTDSSGRHKRTFRSFDPDYAAPEDRHFNPWNPTQSGAWHPGHLLFDKIALYSPTVDEIYPIMAKEWSKPDENHLKFSIKEGWTWHNGDPFTLKDYAIQVEIDTAVQKLGDSKPFITGIELDGDYTATLELGVPYAEKFAASNTIANRHGPISHGVYTKHDAEPWKSWHQRLVKSDDDKERKAALEELVSTPKPKLTEKPPGTGPFKLSAVGDDEIMMEVYEDHPMADKINFTNYSLRYAEDPIQAYKNGIVDAAHSQFPAPPDLRPQMPKESKLVSSDRAHNSLICFNCGHEVQGWNTPFDDPKVRRAVSHVFNKKDLAVLAKSTVTKVFEYPPCRVPHSVLKKGGADWVPIKKFTQYGQNNTEKAATLLKEAGYSKGGDGKWRTPNGKPWTIRIVNESKVQNIVVQVLIKNLNDFGIDTQLEKVDAATFDERRKSGEYDIIPDGSSADGIADMWAPGLWEWVSGLTHHADEVTIPMPVGDPAGSSGTKTINIVDHMNQWRITNDNKFHTELCWAWNQHVPECEVGFEPAAGILNTGNGWSLEGCPSGVVNGTDTVLYDALPLGGYLKSTSNQ